MDRMILCPGSDLSRRDTTHVKAAYLAQLPLDARPGSRGWVHRALRLRVAESGRDRALAARIVRERHYLAPAWPVRPRTLILSYVADLAGVQPGPAGCAAMVMIALVPGRYHALKALDVAPYEAPVLVRSWRADDLGPDLAPDFMPEVLRRIVKGERSRGPLRGMRDEWIARKCREGGLRAPPRLLVTYADPGVGHDGALYRAAGARFCGPGAGGKLLYGWALDPALAEPLRQLEAAAQERAAPPA